MKIFGYTFFEKNKSVETPAIKDAGPSIRPEIELVVPDNKKPANIRAVKPLTLAYTNKSTGSRGRGEFAESDWDLSIIGKAEDVDSFVMQAFMKKIGLMFKEGYEFVGQNPKTVNYIKMRFAQISKATNIPTDELFRAIGSGLVKRSNAFLVKVRNEEASGGKVRVLSGSEREYKPVAGYFVAPAETMKYEADEFGRVSRWKQEMPSGLYKIFKSEDVCHFYSNKKEGFVFGTPITVPVMDDVRTLRKIEENIELLIYQHIFPLFHYKIGTDQYPAGIDEHGRDEISVAESQIRYMPTEGGIVTSHRHDIELIGAESKALRAESYLDHFKKRVFAGLGVSAVDMGEGECYSEDTQTLTENGWKFHWQIDHANEKIATFNPDKNKMEFHIANYKHESKYSGPMFAIKSPGIDIKVTPSHDMWVGVPVKKDSKELVWQKVHADKLSDISDRVYMLGSVTYSGPRTPITNIQYLDKEEIKSISINAFAKLLHLYISCGRVSGKKILFSPSAGSGSYSMKAIANVLTEAGIPLRISFMERKSFLLENPSIVEYLLKYSSSTKTVLDTFPIDTLVMFNNIVLSNSGWNKKSGHRCIEFSSASKVDYLNVLLTSTGNKVSYNRCRNRMGRTNGFVHQLNIYSKRPVLRSILTKKDISQVFYNGTIYCYNVPNHLFITRRNGKMTVQGNTANRATADNMSRNLVDAVKDIQRVFECQLTEQVINELLLESTFGPDVLDEKNRVWIKFKEIDIDAQIKKENHFADQFTKNVVTWDEARKKGAGLEPILVPTSSELESMDADALYSKYPQFHKTFWKLFDEPKALIQSIDEPYTASAKAAAKNPSTSVTPADTEEAAAQQMEHEINIEKEKGKAKVAIAKMKPKPAKKDSFLQAYYKDLELDLVNSLENKTYNNLWFNQLSHAVSTQMSIKLRTNMVSSFVNGYSSINRNTQQQVVALTINRGKLEDRANFYVEKLLKQLRSAIARQIDQEIKSDTIVKAKAVFDALRFRNDFIEETETDRARNLGKITAAKDLGFTKFKSVSSSGSSCESCLLISKKVIDINNVSVDELMPHHPGCTCSLEFLEE